MLETGHPAVVAALLESPDHRVTDMFFNWLTIPPACADLAPKICARIARDPHARADIKLAAWATRDKQAQQALTTRWRRRLEGRNPYVGLAGLNPTNLPTVKALVNAHVATGMSPGPQFVEWLDRTDRREKLSAATIETLDMPIVGPALEDVFLHHVQSEARLTAIAALERHGTVAALPTLRDEDRLIAWPSVRNAARAAIAAILKRNPAEGSLAVVGDEGGALTVAED